jgi:hypothetical protein
LVPALPLSEFRFGFSDISGCSLPSAEPFKATDLFAPRAQELGLVNVTLFAETGDQLEYLLTMLLQNETGARLAFGNVRFPLVAHSHAVE